MATAAVQQFRYLAQVVQILDDGRLPQQEAVGDGLAHHEGGHEVLHGPRLAAVGPEVEGVEAALRPQLVQHAEVGVGVVQVVGVRRVLVPAPLIGAVLWIV